MILGRYNLNEFYPGGPTLPSVSLPGFLMGRFGLGGF